MSERVFADEFYKGFFREGDFLAFIEEREENSDWEKVKSCGFIRLQTDTVLHLCWRKNCGRKERSVYLKTRWNTHG